MNEDFKKLIEESKDREDKTYTVSARCANCGWRGDLLIPKGTPVGHFTSDLVCSNCSCKQVMRA
jgi:hypothetical protein